MTEPGNDAGDAPEPRDPNEQLPASTGLVPLWFGLSADVGPRVYAASGFGLMIVKYAVEAGLLWHYSGTVFLAARFSESAAQPAAGIFPAPCPRLAGVGVLLLDAPVSVDRSRHERPSCGQRGTAHRGWG